ncbi:hypothetical protein [Pedobacter sp. UBA4863]|uniref:hypothetical protein n=1 Tax=Pedobacter sp. UBA4863 TaxID=1947060 RepID=UPI0025CD8FF2|nr:hypothetical protein [Pedobacter sp. UBA4863]
MGSKKLKNTLSEKHHILYVPKGVSIDELLVLFPIQVPNGRDYLVFLLHIIKVGNAYTPLNSKVLRDRYFKNYNSLLNWLMDRGIISTDNKYSVYKNTGIAKFKGYKFTEGYNVKKKPEIISNKILIKKISTPVSSKSNWLEEIINPNFAGYGFVEDIWLTSSDLASRLNLKPIIMIRSLKQMDFIKSREFGAQTWYKYISYKNQFTKKLDFSLRFTEASVNIVKEIANKYPDYFPKKNKIS